MTPPLGTSYTPELLELARSTCLYVHTRVGELSDEIVVAGGLVPALIIPQDPPPEGAERHVGTRDLDLGFSLAVFEGSRYHLIADRFRSAGFEPDLNRSGNPTFQRWRLKEALGVTVDFLIPQTDPADVGGTIRHLERDLAAIITPGLELAFQDRIHVPMAGKTPLGEKAERSAWVCGPGAYVTLKALAFGLRGENKDAYDLFYVIRNFGDGPRTVAEHMTPLMRFPPAAEAMDILERDFKEPEALGPSRVARFMYDQPDGETQADVAGFVSQFISTCRR